MDSTLITHLFKFKRRSLKMIQVTLDKLTITQRSTPSKHKATWIPNSAAKPWSFLSQKCRDRMYNDVTSNPKCPTLKMTQKIHDIDQPNPFPCLQWSSSSFQELFQSILNKALKSRQSNNLTLYDRKLIHSLTFYFLVNESTKMSKNVPKLHHGHKITSSYINSYMKK